MVAEIPATLHLRQKVHVHQKITCVCKQAKNHQAPIPWVEEFHIKVTGFRGLNTSFATS